MYYDQFFCYFSKLNANFELNGIPQQAVCECFRCVKKIARAKKMAKTSDRNEKREWSENSDCSGNAENSEKTFSLR